MKFCNWAVDVTYWSRLILATAPHASASKGLFTLAQLPPLNLSTGWNGLSVDINHLNPNISSFGAFKVS